MATTTTKAPKLTNAKAMAAMVDVFVNGTSVEDAIAKIDGGAFSREDFDAKVTHMLATALKPKAASNAMSKAAIRNKAFAANFAKGFDGETFTTRDVMAVLGFDKAPTATAVVLAGIREGLFEKYGYDGSRTVYRLAE